MKIMNKFILICSVLLIMANLSQAQTGCYKTIKHEGQMLLDKGKFLEAMEKFELADDCFDCPDTNDLRKKQDYCRKGMQLLIDNMSSKKNARISDLLLDLGSKELDEGNYREAVGFFFETLDFSSTLNDSVRILSSILAKSWYPSVTMPWLEKDLSGYNEYNYQNNAMPILFPPYEVISLSQSGELSTGSLKPGMYGDNIIFNREANQIIEFYSDTVALWNNLTDNPGVIKRFNDSIKQVYPGKRGKYLAVSFEKEPLVKIYTLADIAMVNSFKPKKKNLKEQRITRKYRKELKRYNEDLYQYNRELYQYEQNDFYEETNNPSFDVPPFLILQDKLFYLYSDSITVESLNILTGKRRHIKLNDFKIHQMDSSPDENYIVMYGENDVMLYDVSTNKYYPIPSSGIVRGSCRFSPDGKSFAIATSNYFIEMYEMEFDYLGQLKQFYLVGSELLPGEILDYKFNDKGDQIVTLLKKNQVEQVIVAYSLPSWNNISGNVNISYSDIKYVGIVDDYIYGLSENTCYIWKLPLVYVKEGMTGDNYGIEICNPNLNYLPAEENIRALRSLETAINKARSEGSVYRAGLSPGLDYIAISSLGTEFYIYEAHTSKLFREFPVGSMVYDFRFIGGNKIAILCGDGAKLIIYNIQEDKQEMVFEQIRDFQPSNSGDFLSVTMGDGDVIIYSMSSLTEYFRIKPQMYPDSSLVMPSRGWFSPGDNYFAMTTSEGKLMNLNLADTAWTGNSDQELYSYIGSLSWVSDSVYLAGSQYYGYIERISTKTGTDTSFYIFTENVPAEIISIPGKNIVITTSEDGTLSLHDDIKGLQLGLPFIFGGLPEVISYDTATGESMVYVRGDGFYRIERYKSRSAEKIQLQLTDTATHNSYPNLLGAWSFISEGPGGEIMDFAFSLDYVGYSDYYEEDSVYIGNFQYWYSYEDDTIKVPAEPEPIECTYDPYSRILKMEFTGIYGGMYTYHCKAYVSEDGKALHFGTMESYDSPGVNLLQWSGKKQEEPEQGRSEQPGIRHASP